MVIERPEKFGGLVTFSTYKELEAAYVNEEIYPLDLKNGVASQLNKVLFCAIVIITIGSNKVYFDLLPDVRSC